MSPWRDAPEATCFQNLVKWLKCGCFKEKNPPHTFCYYISYWLYLIKKNNQKVKLWNFLLKKRCDNYGILHTESVWILHLSENVIFLVEVNICFFWTNFVLSPFVGMATCCFSSLQGLLPLLGRWWTQPPHTHLHHYHLSHPPPLRPPWCPGPCLHPRSRRTRSISIWPSKTARSTGTKIHSCKRKTCCKHPA